MSPALKNNATQSVDYRPVISGTPQLKLVATPVVRNGFWGVVLLCATILISALAVVFVLNTCMVATAYEIQAVNHELNEARAKESTLVDEVVGASTPQGLKKNAEQLGLVMVNPKEVRHVDLANATLYPPFKGK